MKGAKRFSNRRAMLILMMMFSLWTVRPVWATVATRGSTSGPFHETFTVQGCGRESHTFRSSIVFKSGRHWQATGGGKTYTGLFTENSTRTTLTLTLDRSSQTRLVSNLRSWASGICGRTVRVSSVTLGRIVLRFNRRRTLITGTMTVTGAGSTSLGSGRASYAASFSGSYNGK